MEPFRLPPLPFAADALEPHVSRLTLRTHHGKHHKAYIEKVNAAMRGTPKARWSLERLVRQGSGPLFNAAAQAWNHEFFWHCLRPGGGSRPPAALGEAIGRSFGGLVDLRRAFDDAALAHFGSGWAWLVVTQSAARSGSAKGGSTRARLEVLTTHDAGTPLRDGQLPLLTCDLWEHAFYLDHKSDKAAYLKAFWRVANWDFAAGNLSRGTPYVSQAATAAARRRL